MSAVLYDLKRALRKAQGRLVEHELAGEATYLDDLACAVLRLGIAYQEGRGVHLTADEVVAIIQLGPCCEWPEGMAQELLGHAPGEDAP